MNDHSPLHRPLLFINLYIVQFCLLIYLFSFFYFISTCGVSCHVCRFCVVYSHQTQETTLFQCFCDFSVLVVTRHANSLPLSLFTSTKSFFCVFIHTAFSPLTFLINLYFKLLLLLYKLINSKLNNVSHYAWLIDSFTFLIDSKLILP